MNFSGSVVGWAALYYVLVIRLRVFDRVLQATPGAIDIALLLVTFLGVTGHLPYALVGIASGLNAVAERALRGLADRLRPEGTSR